MTGLEPGAEHEYLGRVADADGTSVGTCFQVEPGVLVTAFHVLTAAGGSAEGAVVSVGPIAGGRLREAVVVRTDAAHDLAVLRTRQPLPRSRPRLTASDTVRPAEELTMAGYAQVEDPGHEYRMLPVGGKWRGPMLLDDRWWGRIRADGVVPGMSGAPVLRVTDGHVVGVISARYDNPGSPLHGSVQAARVEDLVPLLDGVAQAVVNDLRPVGAVPDRAPIRPALAAGHDSTAVPLHLLALTMVSVGLAAAAILIGARYGDARPFVIASPVLVTFLVSIGGVASRWLNPDSRSGIEMWALGTVLLIASVESGMGLSPDAPGRGIIVLMGVPASWLVVPIGIRLFLGLPNGGALPGDAERRLVTASFSLGVAAGVVTLVTKTPVPACANWCGRSPVQLVDDANLYLTIRSGILVALAGLAIVALFLLVRRVRGSSAVERMRSFHLVVVGVSVVALHLAVSLSAVSFYFGPAVSTGPWYEVNLVLGWTLAFSAPVSLLIPLVRRHRMRFRLQNLADHPAGATLQGLEYSIGSILKDPGFRILQQRGHGWHDASGSPASNQTQHARTQVRDDPPMVVLLHDPAYLGDSHLLPVIVRLVKTRLGSTAGDFAAR